MNSELNTNKNDKNNRNLINIDANGVQQNNVDNVGTLGNGNNDKEKFNIKYKNNNLKINAEQQNIATENDPNSGQSIPITATSKFEIQGLKNKTVQDKINNEIKGIIDFYKEHNCITKVEAIANFSDVLSIHIWALSLDTANPAYRSLGLNYRLDNGEKLQFQDLFNTKGDARIALKESLQKKIETYSKDLTKYTTSQKMQGLDIKELAEFDNNKNYDFSFGPDRINVYNIGQETDTSDIRHLTIQMSDYAEKLAIFTEYVSKEYLYEGENNTQGNENNSTDNPAFLNLNKYSSFKKVDDTTYALQYFADDVNSADPAMVEKLKNQADYEVDKIKKRNTGYKLLIQNMSIGTRGEAKTKHISTTVYVVKADYFGSDIFYSDLANGDIIEGAYIVDINGDYVILSDMHDSNADF